MERIIDFLKWREPKLHEVDRENLIKLYCDETIHWEFEEWAEKAVGTAFVKGVDNLGNEYKGTAHYGAGEVQEIIDKEVIKHGMTEVRLPSDKEVNEWFVVNIDRDSASSAIYKFRSWLGGGE